MNKLNKMAPFLTLMCVLATIASASPSAVQVIPAGVIDTIDYPRYAFNYAVSDPLTRDNKAQWETRDGDSVKGSYSVAEPDGSLRVVDYTADDHTGFNAIVKKLGPSVHPIIAPIAPLFRPATAIRPMLTNIHPLLLPKTAAPLIPFVGPLSYGFGGAPIVVNKPYANSRGRWSLPWDPVTHSYGGWRPLSGHSSLYAPKPYVNIYRSQYMDDGSLHKWGVGPLRFDKTLIIKKSH